MNLSPARTLGYLLMLMGCVTGTAFAAERVPISAWIHDPVIDSVDVTPDGRQLAALTLSDINAPPEITVWQTRDLSQPPRRFKPVDVKALGLFWLNDEYLLVVGRQKFDIRAGARPTRWFRNKVYVVDDEGKRFRELMETRQAISIGLFNVLPQHKDRFLVDVTNYEFASDIYEVSLKNFVAKRVYRGASQEGIFADHHGVIRGKQELERAGKDTHIRFSYRHPQTGAWEEHHRLYARDREGMGPVAFDNDGRRVYMVDNTGRERSVIRTYDLITRELGEPLFGGGDTEAFDVLQASNPQDFGEIVGFIGAGDKVVRQYTEPKRLSMQQRLEQALPAGPGTQLGIDVRRSHGHCRALLGPEGSGRLSPAGQRQGSHSARAQLSIAEARRDGGHGVRDLQGARRIGNTGFSDHAPGPAGKPYPAVVLPHGGPWARDYLGWDRWAQFLANRGYAVLQPQYRGSEGFGQTLWRAGDNEWGQKMQDDKDDGAYWLAEQGIADADRIAIFGYSYGGFAAMAASVRRNSPYQCAISGAGLAELRSFDKITFTNPFQRQFQNPTIGGMSPLDHVRDAEIPIFVFHGDRDQRVPVEQSRKFVRALQRAGKDVEYLEIVDLWHSCRGGRNTTWRCSNRWKTILPTIAVQTDCKRVSGTVGRRYGRRQASTQNRGLPVLDHLEIDLGTEPGPSMACTMPSPSTSMSWTSPCF